MQYLQSTQSLRSKYIEVLRVLCREIDTPYSRKCLRELNRNFVRLDQLDIDIRLYNDAIPLVRDRLVNGLISKCPSIPTLANPEEACYSTFEEFEEQCKQTNERFASGRLAEPDVVAVLFSARRKIANILGDVPSVDELAFAFGPGATRNVKSKTSVFHKMIAEPESTLEARASSLRLLASVPRLWTLWGGTSNSLPKLKIVPGSRFGQVPKSAKTNRPIDIEPTLNSVLQKGYGSVIRNRLGRAGNCIRSGQARHAALARDASISKSLATIDFSGASDSISSMLVLDLLPLDWFEALDTCRSHRHLYKGEQKYLQKFSSMGNGFTFELETLIFLSLARATCDQLGIDKSEISVYGDDVILPTEALDLYFKVCDWCGFTINSEKSFWGTDAFRESCGADFWDGVDVRVAYMRHEPSPHHLSTLYNRMVTLGLDQLVPCFMKALADIIPNRFRIFGPPTDHMYGYLHSYDHLKPVMALSVRPRQYRPKGRAVIPFALYSAQNISKENQFHLRFFRDLEEQVSEWEAPLTMERFTVRRDFKLVPKLIALGA